MWMLFGKQWRKILDKRGGIMQAVLLAGGLGTRLRSVVNDRPKPMADICGKPFLEYLILELKKHGVAHIILAVGYKGSMVEEYFGTGKNIGIKIDYSYEETQLGTAGAIKNAERFITDSEFLVLNADTFYQAAYKEVFDLYQKLELDMALVLRRVPDISRYGSVKLENQIIVGFNEKTSEKAEGLINGGIYLIKKSILDVIPDGKKSSLENEIIPALLKSNKKLGAVVNDGYFIDIGLPEDYYRFIKDIGEQKIKF